MVLAIYIQTGIQVNANRVPSWAQLGVKLDQMWIHLNSSGPPWIQSNPFAAYLGLIGFQTTTININTNNRFLLPRGGLTVKTYINCKNIYASIHIYIEIYIMSKWETDEATVAISTKRKNNIQSHRCLNLLA